MNRIKLSPLASVSADELSTKKPAPNALDQFDKITNRSDQYSLFVPLHYEKNYAYPLIVWLHSDGSQSAEIQRIMPHASVRNFVGVAPQSPIGNFEAGYFWEQEVDTIDLAHDSILAAIDAASMRYNIASNRIFIGGAGTGGTMALRIAFERPEIFAGVISINGPLPEREKPLGCWAESRQLPVFWAHGRNNKAFKQSQLCQQLRLLHIAGFSVTLRQYPTEVCTNQKTLSDMNRWIMETIDSTVV
jgi:phospholipase/carboxylesterase